MFQLALIAVAANKFGLGRLKAVGRVAAYTAGITLVLGAIGVHKARAAVVESGLKVGEDLVAVAPFLKNTSTLNVNGQRVHFSSADTLDGTTAVLDKFQTSCEQADGGDAAVWTGIPTNPDDVKSRAHDLDKMPVVRQQNGNDGFIACLVPTAGMTGKDLRDAAMGFMHDHKSLKIGRLRYATVKGSPTGSSVVTVWTDESFDLGALMPDPDHDKPGVDPGVMLRPNDSIRLMSGTVEQLPYKFFLYNTKLSPKEAIDAYDAQMIAKGWVSIQVPQAMAMPQRDGFGLRAYMRDGFIGYVTTGKGPNDKATMVGVGETASIPKPADADGTKLKDADGF